MKNMKQYLIMSGITVFVILVGLLIWGQGRANNDDFLVRNNLDGKSLSQIVDTLENRLNDPAGFTAGINGERLVMTDTKGSHEILLPNNQFYLSIAPYINQTHPCGIHNLVTCRGELKNQTFLVVVTNTQTNEVILNQNVKTANNGFMGIWLPRGLDVTVTVSQGSLTASTQVGTYSDSDTCLTTLKLT